MKTYDDIINEVYTYSDEEATKALYTIGNDLGRLVKWLTSVYYKKVEKVPTKDRYTTAELGLKYGLSYYTVRRDLEAINILKKDAKVAYIDAKDEQRFVEYRANKQFYRCPVYVCRQIRMVSNNTKRIRDIRNYLQLNGYIIITYYKGRPHSRVLVKEDGFFRQVLNEMIMSEMKQK